MITLRCDMTRECQAGVTHIDEQGYIYCLKHGHQRKMTCRCRQLKPAELKRLQGGEPLRSY